MIVVKLELHSTLDGSVTDLGRMYISNDGTGTSEVGNYNVKIMRKGVLNQDGNVWKYGRIERHSRKAVTVWILIVKAISAYLKRKVL